MRSAEPFVVLDCDRIPRAELRAELFGVVQRSPGSQHRSRVGAFRRADGGTLYLHEIQQIPKELQADIVALLRSNELRVEGSDEAFVVDVRLLLATTGELATLRERSVFAPEFIEEVSTCCVELPALRERPEDLQAIIQTLLEELGSGLELSPAANALLCESTWSGNVQQLKHTLACACALAQGRSFLDIQDFPMLRESQEVRSGNRHSTIIPPPYSIPISVPPQRSSMSGLRECECGESVGILNGSFDETLRPGPPAVEVSDPVVNYAATMLPPPHCSSTTLRASEMDGVAPAWGFPSSLPTEPVRTNTVQFGMVESTTDSSRSPNSNFEFPPAVVATANELWSGGKRQRPSGKSGKTDLALLRAALVYLSVKRLVEGWPDELLALRSKLFEPEWGVAQEGRAARDLAVALGLDPRREWDACFFETLCECTDIL